MTILEKLQKRAVKWIWRPVKYGQQLCLLQILPLPMHIQILNVFYQIFLPVTTQLSVYRSGNLRPQEAKNLQGSQDQV